MWKDTQPRDHPTLLWDSRGNLYHTPLSPPPQMQNPRVQRTNDIYCTENKSENLVAQSCPTLCDPIDYSPPGSSVPWIAQARILEWIAMPSSRGTP